MQSTSKLIRQNMCKSSILRVKVRLKARVRVAVRVRVMVRICQGWDLDLDQSSILLFYCFEKIGQGEKMGREYPKACSRIARASAISPIGPAPSEWNLEMQRHIQQASYPILTCRLGHREGTSIYLLPVAQYGTVCSRRTRGKEKEPVSLFPDTSRTNNASSWPSAGGMEPCLGSQKYSQKHKTH